MEKTWPGVSRTQEHSCPEGLHPCGQFPVEAEALAGLQTWCGKGGIPREQQARRPTVTSRGQHLTPDPGRESSLQQVRGTGWSPGRQMPAPSQAPSTVLLSHSVSSPGPARGCGDACRSAGAPAGRPYLPGCGPGCRCLE